ncbi:MAG: hypothetical protein PVH84_07020 [Candidatus Aminicenantes bacterium]
MIPVRFHVEERNLIVNETLTGPDLTDRLKSTKQVAHSVVVYYSSEELENLIGYIAAEANHNPDKQTQEDLDALYDSLDALLDAYVSLKDLQNEENHI